MMHWLETVDWPAVVAALIALWNAVQHKAGQAQRAADHRETLKAVQNVAPPR